LTANPQYQEKFAFLNGVATADLASNAALQSHSASFTNAVGVLAQNIDNEAVAGESVKKIAAKHQGLSIGEADLQVS
jgi:hemoglobin-like flavoprotein